MDEITQYRSSPLVRAGFSVEGNGSFEGVANRTGVLDSYFSVVFPGAWSRVAPAFVASGCVLMNHDWFSVEVGFPTAASEEGQDYRVSAEFHATERGQEARQVTTARMDAGKSVELSVGFWPDYSKVTEFGSGEELLKYAKGCGCNMAHFDKAIKDHKSYCYAIPEVSDHVETSIVHRAATPGSQIVAARSAAILNDLSSGSLAVRLDDHLDRALAAVRGVTVRVRGLRDARADEGRVLPEGRRNQVRSLLDAIVALEAELGEPITHRKADVTEIEKRLRDAEIAHRLMGLKPL